MPTVVSPSPSPKPSPPKRAVRPQAFRSLPILENGDHLSVTEFLRRYEAMTGLRKAQLIEGKFHMPSPVSASHAIPDGHLQGWLYCYALAREGLECLPNATLILDADNALQPDAILCSTPRKGGRVWLNDKNYLCGAPELVCEIAASSALIDLHEKFRVYRRNGVQEYFVWLTLEKKVRWFHLIDQEYVEIKERAGKLSSVVFPGLILDVKALIKMDRKRIIAALK